LQVETTARFRYLVYMQHDHHGQSVPLNRTAFSATLHCLTGCAIGEVAGMAISTAFSWGAAPSIVISIVLAFMFGYLLTIRTLLRSGIQLGRALKLAFASDTASITVMEIADNAFILVVPGAIHAGLHTFLFWWSMVLSLVLAFIFAFPLNRYLISKGKGHAVVHERHH
jgi:hypothetical protein